MLSDSEIDWPNIESPIKNNYIAAYDISGAVENYLSLLHSLDEEIACNSKWMARK